MEIKGWSRKYSREMEMENGDKGIDPEIQHGDGDGDKGGEL